MRSFPLARAIAYRLTAALTSAFGGEDTEPDSFGFVDKSAQELSTVVTSDPVTVQGINSPAAITVAGGQYSINGGGFTSTAGVVEEGDQVRARATSSASENTAVNVVVTIGGVADTFTITTGDATPAAFTFTDLTTQQLSTQVTSAPVTLSGLTISSPISVTGGEYSINGGAFTSSAGTVVNGDQIRARHTTSASDATNTDTVVTIGGVSDTFRSTTGDATPAAFTFVDQTDVAPSSTITSAAIVLSGMNIAGPISITNGTYNINGGAYTASAGTVVNGDSITVRHTSSASSETNTDTVLTVRGVSDTFRSTTRYVTSTPSDYDVTNDYMERGAGLTGLADGKTGLISFWFRVDGGNGTDRVVMSTNSANSNSFFVRLTTVNQITVVGRTSLDALTFQVTSSSSFTAGAAWHHVLCSYNLATGVGHLYIDDASDNAGGTNNNNDIDYTEGNFAIGAHVGGGSKFNGCLSEIWFHDTFLDISSSSNRRKFISAALKPVNLGSTGQTPTGSSPRLYLKDGAEDNLGTGGDFTVTGALTACSSNPSS